MTGPSNDPEQVLSRVIGDYEHSQALFEDKGTEEDVDLPLKEVLNELEQENEFTNDQERSLYVTFTLTLNFSRPADRLSRRLKNLWLTERWMFDPQTLVKQRGYHELLDLFKGREAFQNHPVMTEHGLMEYGKQDAAFWYTVAYSLCQEFDSNPLVLVSEYDEDAHSVYQYVREARLDEPAHEAIQTTKKFPGLGGEKIAPLWLRAIDDYIHPLDNIALLPIPVDIQLARVTNFLFGTDYSADNKQDREEMRTLYRGFCEENNHQNTRLDKSLWLIGENWKSGGRAYLEQKMNQV
jgi:hypothetical protein